MRLRFWIWLMDFAHRRVDRIVGRPWWHDIEEPVTDDQLARYRRGVRV